MATLARSLRLDRPQRGTHYADRMQRILGACQDCGLLWHDEHVRYRNGSSEIRRMDDITSLGQVVLTPRYEIYRLHVAPSRLRAMLSLDGQIASALNVQSVSIERDGDTVNVRVPRDDAAPDEQVTFTRAWQAGGAPPLGELLLGLDDEARQFVVELTAPTCVHAAVIGMTGSGKSTLMQTMALSALKIGGAKVALFDPIGETGALWPLSGHPSVWRGGLFIDPAHIAWGLRILATGMGRGGHDLTYVFVDEVPGLAMREPATRDYISQIATSGRHSGLHLVLGAQHTVSGYIDGTTTKNIPVRLVGKVADRTTAYHAAGRPDSSAWALRGRGDFVAVNGANVRRFQAAQVEPDLLKRWAATYPPREARAMPDVTPGLPAGRPIDDIPPFVVDWIVDYVAEHGEPPSLNAIARYTASNAGAEYNRAKARRALAAAGYPAAGVQV